MPQSGDGLRRSRKVREERSGQTDAIAEMTASDFIKKLDSFIWLFRFMPGDGQAMADINPRVSLSHWQPG
jgi:hypothetical protein